MICTLLGSVMMLSAADGSSAVLLTSNQPVHIYAEKLSGGTDAVVHLLGRTKIEFQGHTADEVIQALKNCRRPEG